VSLSTFDVFKMGSGLEFAHDGPDAGCARIWAERLARRRTAGEDAGGRDPTVSARSALTGSGHGTDRAVLLA